MAACPRCHAPLKPGAFTCHNCGLTIGAAAAAKPDGRNARVRLIVAGCGIAIAIAAAWFLILRGPATTGDEYLGVWRSASVGSIGSATVTREGGDFSILLTAAQSGQTATVPAHLDGNDLVVTPGDFSASGDPNAKQFGLLLKLYAGDFRMALASVDAAHLLLRFTGTSPAGSDVDERDLLEKIRSSPSPQ